MLRGKTSTGFEFEINEAELDDMEFLDALAEVEENPLTFSKVCQKLLGTEQKKRLYNHLRDKNGKVPIAKVSEAVEEIMMLSGEDVKNS